MTRSAFCFICLAVLILAVGSPPAQSDYEFDECIEDCRVAIDPDKDANAYAECVENCKRNKTKDEL